MQRGGGGKLEIKIDTDGGNTVASRARASNSAIAIATVIATAEGITAVVVPWSYIRCGQLGIGGVVRCSAEAEAVS